MYTMAAIFFAFGLIPSRVIQKTKCSIYDWPKMTCLYYILVHFPIV